jgi:hypothetical protein
VSRLRKHVSFANVIAVIALFIALGGTAYAVDELGKNSVGTKQLKKDAVTSVKVKDGSLLPQDFKKGALPSGAAGATGATGATGPAGPQGSPGAPGSPGGGEGGGGGSEVVPAASATNSISQSTTNNTIAALKFDSESFDTADMHPSGAESRKLIAPKAGIYALTANVGFEGKSAGSGGSSSRSTNRR